MATNNAVNAPFPLSATQGGTGVASPTTHTLPVAAGSSVFSFLGPLTNGQLLIGSTGNDPSVSGLTAGTGTTITVGAGTITIASNGADVWVDQTTSSVTMTVNRGYTSDAGASLVTYTLPAVAALGDWFEINGKGSGGWTIAQASGQTVHFGNVTTTITTGTLASSNQYDCIKIRCITANSDFTVVSAIGNITYT